jgi:hypothetical protein
MFKIDTFLIYWSIWAVLSCSVFAVWSAIKQIDAKKFIIRLFILGAINFTIYLAVRIIYYF